MPDFRLPGSTRLLLDANTQFSSVVRRNLVSRILRFGGCRRLHQLVQLAYLSLQQVDLLLLAKHRAIELFEMILAQAQLDFEFRDSGFHADFPLIQ